MERRVIFDGWLFPVLLLLPQLAVTAVFFFWPAAQALLQSVQRQDAFGLSTHFVGWTNFAAIFADPSYLASVEVSFIFGIAVAALALGSRAAVRGDGRPGRSRRCLLQDGADATLRDRPGNRRRIVAVPVQSELRHRRARHCAASALIGTIC